MDSRRLLGFIGLLIFIVSCLSTAGLSAVQYQAIDVGQIGSFAFDFEINNSGAIVGPVGYFQGSTYGPQASIWYPDGTRHDLGYLWGDTDTATYAINDAGEVVSYVHGQVYRWSEASGPIYMGALPTAWKSCPLSINEHGGVVGWAYLSDHQQHGVLWREDGSIADLGRGSANDINDLSQIVGTSDGGSWPPLGVMWNADGTVAHAIGAVDPQGINNAAQVIGYRWDGSSRRCAFFWSEPTGLFDLPLLPGATDAYEASYAHGINERGQIVGYSVDALGRRRPVLWDSPTSIMDLQPLPGYPYGEAYGINDRGWVVGYSSDVVNGGGEYHLTLWKPVPEPSSLLALGSGLIAVGLPWLRRRRG